MSFNRLKNMQLDTEIIYKNHNHLGLDIVLAFSQDGYDKKRVEKNITQNNKSKKYANGNNKSINSNGIKLNSEDQCKTSYS